MPASTMTYVLSHIKANIPIELLNLALKPRTFNTTVENRIISEIVEGPIILDTNLVGGKRRDIVLSSAWEIDLRSETTYSLVGPGVEGAYYKIPEEAREYRNLSSVIGVTSAMASSVPGSSINHNGSGGFGNTVPAMLSAMVNSRTFAQYPITPMVSLEGTNIVRFNPRQLVDGCAVTVMLEYDSEFLNMNQSAIMAMSNLCLCATQRYIATKLLVTIDETEVVAGMEIGVIKDLVSEYRQAGQQYHELLVKLKGAMHYDSRSLSKLIYYGL